MSEAPCPDCGQPFASDSSVHGLCPHCLLRLALGGSESEESPTVVRHAEKPSDVQILGNRYQFLSLLGRGRMGEVWRAVDLKLRVDVALKAVRADFVANKRAEEFLRDEVWPEARPLTLRRNGSWFWANSAFHPRGDWLAVLRGQSRLTFWPLRRSWPRVVDGFSHLVRPLAFSPDSRWLATSWVDDTLRLWPLPGSGSREVRTLPLPEKQEWTNLVFDPQGRFLVVVGNVGGVYVAPIDGSAPRRLEDFADFKLLVGGAVSPSGRFVATASFRGGGHKALRVWNVETGERRVWDLPEGSSSETGYEQGIQSLAFADESTLYTAGDGGLRRWNLESGEQELVFPTEPGYLAVMALGPEGKALVHAMPFGGGPRRFSGPIEIVDLTKGMSRAFALGPTGAVVVNGDGEGILRVGRLSGAEPHLLVGHEGPVDFVAISPDLRWVASTGEDDTLRLWPMPDLSKPPLHTLPHDKLIAKLKSLTNLRLVRDPESAEGWKVELDPFPGWKDVPTW